MTPEGGWLVATLRAVSDASLLSMMGAVAFRAGVGPAGLGVARWSAAAACLALPGWAMAETVDLSGRLGDVADVLFITQFGHLVAGSWVCALAVLVVAGRGWRLGVALAVAVVGVVLQAGHSHAAAMDGGVSLLRVSVTLHLLAAGAWLGGLAPLGWVVAHAPLPDAAAAVRRYSVLGLGCVFVLVATAAWQASVLVGGLAGWVGTEYGIMAVVKAGLFAALAGFAAVNRFWLTPRLADGQVAWARRTLGASIAAESVVGLAVVVVAAAVLSSLEPAMHQQPVWPFSYQPSLVSVQEDADLRREVVLAAVALGGAVAVVSVALVLRRFRVVAFAIAAAVAVVAAPHLGLLFVPAYPSSAFVSPTGFAASSIVWGNDLFAAHCTGCHGADGRGHGPLAARLPIPPADLTAEHLWMHSDGELFWWIAHGIEAPEGGLAMPGLDTGALGDTAVWALIDYVRAHNAGLVRRESGGWSPPVQAPDLVASCGDGRQATMTGLRGRMVRLVFPGQVEAPPLPEAVTLTAAPSGAGCLAADPAVAAAYAIILGVPPAALPGTSVVIDTNGWLRAYEPGRLDAPALAALVRQARSHPLDPVAGGHAHAE